MTETEHQPSTSRSSPPAIGQREQPATLVVSGGRRGVGATTLALGLAKALAQDAFRIVAIDADRQRATLAEVSGVETHAGIDEVLSGRKTIHEALTRGPDGLQLLTGAISPSGLALAERAIERLLRQMKTLARHSDFVVVDAGNESTDLAARLWEVAGTLVLVTSPEAAAVMDTYALIKLLLPRILRSKTVSLVVSQVLSEEQAADVHRRIDQSCRRFLGISIDPGGHLPLTTARGMSEELLALAYAALARKLLGLPVAPALSPLAA